MKQKIIGCYDLGPQSVQLVLCEGTGGWFFAVPESGSVPRIKVGADSKDWARAVETLTHEVAELAMMMTGCRHAPAPDYGSDNGGYLFVMTHTQFSEVAARTGMYLSACLPDLSREWNKWRKEGGAKTKR